MAKKIQIDISLTWIDKAIIENYINLCMEVFYVLYMGITTMCVNHAIGK